MMDSGLMKLPELAFLASMVALLAKTQRLVLLVLKV